MPLFFIDIEKLLATEYWSNRYVVDALDLNAAAVLGVTIKNLERGIHLSNVTFTKLRASTITPGDGQYTIVPVNQTGQRDLGTSLAVSLFNVVRCDFFASSGRPSRKFLRGRAWSHPWAPPGPGPQIGPAATNAILGPSGACIRGCGA